MGGKPSGRVSSPHSSQRFLLRLKEGESPREPPALTLLERRVSSKWIPLFLYVSKNTLH